MRSSSRIAGALERPGETDVARTTVGGVSFDALSARHFSRAYPPHFHDTYAIGVVESGATRISTHRGQWVARAGAILAFAPGEVHAAEPLGPMGYTYRMIYPSAAFLSELGARTRRDDGESVLFSAPVLLDAALATDLVRAHAPLMNPRDANPDPDALLVALSRLMATHSAPDRAPNARAIDLEMAERTRVYLQRHFAERVRMSVLAEELDVSVFHLIRTFHRVVGVPPYAYLVQLRINHAQALLATGAGITDVAFRCGFSDQSHLTRMFKRALGVPPGQYGRQVRPRHPSREISTSLIR